MTVIDQRDELLAFADVLDDKLSAAYLSLLQFFLNHRRFLRSRRPERVGKSPRQLMTGQDHSHWLTLLGLGDPDRQLGTAWLGQGFA